ncbi:hypothetical protein DFH11DRAFT_1732166 [Phellopilus nigrolimitatus]|nr:hypothetical protein DFH11DRAFT_1732166 [Phellopilus nigrolimitatus]
MLPTVGTEDERGDPHKEVQAGVCAMTASVHVIDSAHKDEANSAPDSIETRMRSRPAFIELPHLVVLRSRAEGASRPTAIARARVAAAVAAASSRSALQVEPAMLNATASDARWARKFEVPAKSAVVSVLSVSSPWASTLCGKRWRVWWRYLSRHVEVGGGRVGAGFVVHAAFTAVALGRQTPSTAGVSEDCQSRHYDAEFDSIVMSDPRAVVANMRGSLRADGEAGVEAVEEVARPEMTGTTGAAAAATGTMTGIAVADTETIMREEGEVADAAVVEVTMATVSTTEVRMAVLRPRRIIAMEVLGHLALRSSSEIWAW